MRIAIIADFDVMGGTRTYFEMLADLLHGAGHELVGFVPSSVAGDDDFVSLLRKNFKAWQAVPRRDGIFAVRQPFAVFWEWRHLLPFVLRYRPQALFFTHGTPGHWLSALWLSLPSVHVLHSCVLTNKPPEQWVLPLLLWRLGTKRRLCTVSHFAAGLIHDKWHAPAEVIYNPAPQNCLTPPAERQGGIRIVTMGHVIDYKNPYTWLSVAQRVLAQHPEVSFVWYGEGPLLERLRHLSSGLKGVSFPGRTVVPQEVLNDADVYFQPSDLESLGISVIEAMGHGLPCVVSNAGGLPESVTDGFNGFVLAPDDAPGMAEALCRLIESATMRSIMGKAGKNRSEEKFSFGVWANKTLSLVNNITGR